MPANSNVASLGGNITVPLPDIFSIRCSMFDVERSMFDVRC